MASAKPDLADTGNPGYDDLSSDLFPDLIRADDGSDLNADLREFPAGADRGSDYLRKSLKQVLLGNYTGDVTALETLGQIAPGLAGLDTAADIRDLTYGLIHREWTPEHMGQTALDAVGFLPLIGALKNTVFSSGCNCAVAPGI